MSGTDALLAEYESAQRPVGLTLTAAEIASLRHLATKAERPWWRDHPFMVSALAFLLSLITSTVSAYGAYVRDIHDEQAKLAANVRTLQDLNIKQVELHETYKDTPYEGQVSLLIVNTINSALQSASKLALDLQSRASAADLLAIAQGDCGVSENETCLRLLKASLAAADSISDKGAALRNLGWFMIRIDKSPEGVVTGENYYRQALGLEGEIRNADPGTIAWLRQSTLLGWAAAVAPLDCASARTRFADGVRALLTAPDTIDFQNAKSAAKRQFVDGIGGVPSCQPDAGTPRLG